jgi:fumarylpyruvate hydrolase
VQSAILFFAKPADALVISGTTVPYPPLTQNFHFEIELVVAVGAAATNVSEAKAHA